MKFTIDTTTKTITVYNTFTLKELEDELKSIFKDDISNYQIIVEPITLTVDRYIVKDVNPFNIPYSPNPYRHHLDIICNNTVHDEWKKDYIKDIKDFINTVKPTNSEIFTCTKHKTTFDIEKPKNPMV